MGTMKTYHEQAKKAAKNVKNNIRTMKKLASADGTSAEYGPNGPMAKLSLNAIFPGAIDTEATGSSENMQKVFNTLYKRGKGASINDKLDGLTPEKVNTLEYMYQVAKEYDGETDLEDYLGVSKRGRPKGAKNTPKTFLDEIKAKAKGEG